VSHIRSASVIWAFCAPFKVESGTEVHVETVDRTCAYIACCCGVKDGECDCCAFGEGAVNGICVGPVVRGGLDAIVEVETAVEAVVETPVETPFEASGIVDEADLKESAD